MASHMRTEAVVGVLLGSLRAKGDVDVAILVPPLVGPAGTLCRRSVRDDQLLPCLSATPPCKVCIDCWPSGSPAVRRGDDDMLAARMGDVDLKLPCLRESSAADTHVAGFPAPRLSNGSQG